MSEEINNLKQLLNAYKSTYASKKGFSKPSTWYPRTAKEIDNLLNHLSKIFLMQKKMKQNLKIF